MFKIHFGKEGHTLTEEDFKYLASKTEGYSGSDISGMVKQALMLPVQRMQKAKYFCINPNDNKYYPCNEHDVVGFRICYSCLQGAIEISLFNIPSGRIEVPQFHKVCVFLYLSFVGRY